MNRRDFLRAAAALTGVNRACRSGADDGKAAHVMTVRGSITPDQLGVTLPHEYVLGDFIGADRGRHDRYDADEVFQVALPSSKRLREVGCRTVAECTLVYVARDPRS